MSWTPDEVTVKIQGELWQIKFLTKRQMPKDTWGVCDRHKRLIRVRCDLSPQNVLDTLIHELRHSQHPIAFEAEEWIDSTSTELAAALMATGRIHVATGRGG